MTDDTESTTEPDEQHEDSLPLTVREGLRSATVPLATTDPLADRGDLASIGEQLADAAVVGLGESTHGTREFFELKHRILRHLVVEHGVRAFALEANFPESIAVHDYVVHGDGDPRQALAGLGSWVWEVESVLAIVEWLREFNADRPVEDRVVFYGFGGYSTHEAVERLRSHLETVDPGFLQEVSDNLDALDDEGVPPMAADDVAGRLAAGERAIPAVREHLDRRRKAHVETTSERAWTRARRYLVVIEQVLDRTDALAEFDADAMDPNDYLRKMRRDGLPGRTMADTVAWIRDHTDADTLVLWAHDAHLNRVAYTHPGVEETAPNLGSYLAGRHGEDYYALGFSFARGRFQAASEEGNGHSELREQHLDGPLRGTMDAALHALEVPLGLVDLRTARKDDRTADWLAEPRFQFRTGGTYDPRAPEDHLQEYVYTDAFDGLCFVEETTHTRPPDGIGETEDANEGPDRG